MRKGYEFWINKRSEVAIDFHEQIKRINSIVDNKNKHVNFEEKSEEKQWDKAFNE